MNRAFGSIRFSIPPGAKTRLRQVPGAFFLLLYLAFLLFPYMLAWWRQGEAWVFTGFLFAVEDGHSYIAKMLLGHAGAWRFTTPYTVEPQRGYLLFGPYLLLGKLAWGPDPHGALVFLFHAFRVLAALALTWATYRFLGLFLPGKGRALGTLLALLGGGLGWVPLLAGVQADLLPFAWYSPEGFGFLMLLGLPHLALARALLLLLLLRWWDHAAGLPLTRPRTAGLALGSLALGWVHGFELVPLTVLVLAGLAVHLVSRTRHRREALGAAAALLLGAAPWLAYLLTLSRWDPFARAWTEQNVLPTPPAWILAWAYAWVLPWAAKGLWGLHRDHPARGRWAALWVAAAFLLAHLPHPLQRRFLEGVWVALAALTVRGLIGGRKASFGAGAGVVALSLVGTGLFWLALVRTALTPSLPSFRPAREAAAFRALAHAARPADPVMAAHTTGNALPAWAPVRVPLGLGPESIHYPTWQARVQRFYRADTPDAWRLDLLRTWGFRFVFHGPHEQALGGWNPNTAAYLQLLTRSGPYAVYRVVLP